ncbi:hypothetical protein GCM10027160_14080 [Streptomyces calidiresistens]
MASRNEARRTGHAEIHPAHPELGLLSQPEAIGTGVLLGRIGSVDAVREAAETALPPVTVDAGVPDLVPYANASRKVLELTFREALRLEHTSVGTEYILLSPVKQEGGSGPLAGLGVRKPEVEADVEAAVTEADRRAAEREGGDGDTARRGPGPTDGPARDQPARLPRAARTSGGAATTAAVSRAGRPTPMGVAEACPPGPGGGP